MKFIPWHICDHILILFFCFLNSFYFVVETIGHCSTVFINKICKCVNVCALSKKKKKKKLDKKFMRKKKEAEMVAHIS